MSYVLYFLFPCYYIFINTVTECERFIFPFSQFCLIIENIRFHIKKKIFSPIIRRIHVDYFKPRHEAVRILAHIMYPHVNVQIELAMIFPHVCTSNDILNFNRYLFWDFFRSFIDELWFCYFSMLIIFRIFYP